MDTKTAIKLLTDEALKHDADANDSNGAVRQLVTAHGLGFNAWFCVCCEIADRKAQSQGYENQGHRAASLIGR
jgi:hypothetical protein